MRNLSSLVTNRPESFRGKLRRFMPKVAVYPGSFDPITNGHLDVIQRASAMFDQVVVGVAHNPDKIPMFSLKRRLDLVAQATKHLANVTVDDFQGLLVEYCLKKGATVVVRGLRAVSDFEFEFQMALMNRKLE